MSKNPDNENNEQSSFWSQDFISIILIPIISGIIGIILNVFGEICPWYYLVAGLGISLMFILVFYLLGLLFVIPRIDKYIEKKAQELCEKAVDKSKAFLLDSSSDIVAIGLSKYEHTSSMLEELTGKYLTLQQMIEMERSGSFFGKPIIRIDAITSTLKYEVPETDELDAQNSYFSAIATNLQNGVRYNYYYPATPKNSDYKRLIMNSYQTFVANGQIHFYEVSSSDSDFLVEDFDFTLYTVSENETSKTYCILGIGTYLGAEQEPIMILAGQKMTDRILSIYSKYNPEI